MSFKSIASKQKINLGTIEDGKLNYQGVLEDRDKSHLLKFKLAGSPVSAVITLSNQRSKLVVFLENY